MTDELPTMDEQMEAQQDMETQTRAQERAANMGRQSQQLQELVDNEDLLDELLDFDLGDEELESSMSPEFSKLWMTTNLNSHEVEMMQAWTDSDAHLKSKEHPKRDSLATGTRGMIMYGELTPAEAASSSVQNVDKYKPAPPLTPGEERRIWSAADAKKAAISRSKGGWLIRKLTEFVAVGVNEKREEDSEGGFLSGLKKRFI